MNYSWNLFSSLIIIDTIQALAIQEFSLALEISKLVVGDVLKVCPSQAKPRREQVEAKYVFSTLIYFKKKSRITKIVKCRFV